jgi:hypothetical protein
MGGWHARAMSGWHARAMSGWHARAMSGWHARRYSDGRDVPASIATPIAIALSVPPAVSASVNTPIAIALSVPPDVSASVATATPIAIAQNVLPEILGVTSHWQFAKRQFDQAYPGVLSLLAFRVSRRSSMAFAS